MEIDGLPLSILTPLGALCLVLAVPYLLIARGKLVPRSTLDDMVHDRDEWRGESRLKDAQLAEKDKQLAHLEAVGHTVNAIMRSVQAKALDDGGGPT